MRDELFDRKTDALCSLEEVEGCCVISESVYPRTNGCDFLGADIKVGVDRCVAAVDEEAEFAETAAVTDELII